MIDPIPHALLFVLAATAIVFAGATFTDLHDGPLLRGLAKKLAWFCGWCAVVCALMLLVEHTLAATR
ncbi:MAG: hypothetical protein IPJ19_08885 [Planctomycetes bacterium]|nr:hypothetical protein [Planctomycetota bacterium]